VIVARPTPLPIATSPTPTILHDLLTRDAGHPVRFWILTVASTLAAALVLYGFHRMSWQRSEEEERRETILQAIRADG